MFFNPDPKKPEHEAIFSWEKKNEETHPRVFYNNIEVCRTDSQKHLRLFKSILKINYIKRILVLVR